MHAPRHISTGRTQPGTTNFSMSWSCCAKISSTRFKCCPSRGVMSCSDRKLSGDWLKMSLVRKTPKHNQNTLWNSFFPQDKATAHCSLCLSWRYLPTLGLALSPDTPPILSGAAGNSLSTKLPVDQKMIKNGWPWRRVDSRMSAYVAPAHW